VILDVTMELYVVRIKNRCVKSFVIRIVDDSSSLFPRRPTHGSPE
jgi:hypothetical protein